MRAFVVALLLCACASTTTTTTTSTSTSTSTTTLLPPVTAAATTTAVPPPPPGYELRGCTNAQPRPWSVMCRAFELITAHHVDRPDPASLSAAAVAGVRRAGSEPGEAAGDSAPLACIIPDRTFEPLCEAIAARHHLDGTDPSMLIEAAVQGMFRLGLDPFSAYIAPDFADRLDALGSGHVFSLGLVVGARDVGGAPCGPIGESCLLTVLAVFDFGPAERAGVLVGDVIDEIDGTPTAGLSEAEAVASLHASAGDTTSLTVPRATGPVAKDLVHEDLRFDPVEFAMLTPSIAYLRVNDFSQEAAQLVGLVLAEPDVQEASGLVLDLRDNPGGLVLSAQAIASQFLDGGIVMTEESRTGTFPIRVIDGGLAPADLQLVVLTNRGSASASEVVAAALQGRGRATVVGQPTFGKNLVQQVFAAPGGGEYRISVARWEGPDGVDVGVSGLQPDVVIDDDASSTVDEVLEAALGMLGR